MLIDGYLTLSDHREELEFDLEVARQRADGDAIEAAEAALASLTISLQVRARRRGGALPCV